MKTLIIKPRVSEKAYGASQTLNTYVFDVPKSSNKQMIKAAVQAQYNVQVETVNVTILKGKVKRFITNGRSKFGSRSDIKKAYVTLKKGDSLPIFAAVTEEAEKTEKAQKAADKAAKKEKK